MSRRAAGWRAVGGVLAGAAALGFIAASLWTVYGDPSAPNLADRAAQRGGVDGAFAATPASVDTTRRGDASSSDPLERALGGPFRLVDHHGVARTERDPDGKAQLVFFGFTRCEAMCLLTLPDIGATVDLLAERGHAVRPLMITVDPDGDTPEAMKAAMPSIHPDMLGLTGSAEALAAARRVFQVSAERLGETPDGVPIYAHGLFIYLLDGDGRFLTLMPPILGPEKMAAVASRYLDDRAGG